MAGRKRCREEVGDSDGGGCLDEFKRMRHLEAGGGGDIAAGQCVVGGGGFAGIGLLGGQVAPTDNGDCSMDDDRITVPSTQRGAPQAPFSSAPLYSSHVPIANDGMCSHNFYCSHKYKNAPCI